MTSFRDQKHINYVRDELWVNARRATVMIGAGFSRNSVPAFPGAGESPLWSELARDMSHKLHQAVWDDNKCVSCENSGAGDALRIAQRYQRKFGKRGLHQFMQRAIRDGDLRPGEIHQRMLQLPWRDVFTTNWDTLLERARDFLPEKPYHVVNNKDEIALAGAPRIVKLHGSINGHFPLIATELDYETYPERYAPFVNLVQQAMMESALILIGFSGSDPNFRKWSSWVSQNLGDAAPKIFLAGWLELSEAQRDDLRFRNVNAIDVSRHPQAKDWPEKLQHEYATRWILHSLELGRPYDVTDWPKMKPEANISVPKLLEPVESVLTDSPKPEESTSPSSSSAPEIRSSILEMQLVWAHNRNLYPGWIVLPHEKRATLMSRVQNSQANSLKSIDLLSAIEKLMTIRELVWRYSVSLYPISSELESAAVDTLLLIETLPERDSVEIREARREISLALITAARYRLDECEFEQRIEIAEQFSDDDLGVADRINHERCLWFSWTFDLINLDAVLSDWDTNDSDPMWSLRKAALLSEIGREAEAVGLVSSAMAQISRIPTDDRSVVGQSREGWGLWSYIDWSNRLRVLDRWDRLASVKCDASAEIRQMIVDLSKPKRSDEAADFDGRNLQRTQIIFGSDNSFNLAFKGLRLSEIAGLTVSAPKAIGPRASGAEIVRLASAQFGKTNAELSIRQILRSFTFDKDKNLNRLLSRVNVARLDDDEVQKLIDSCIVLIDHGTAEGWFNRVRVAVEVLSRLVLRLKPDPALKIFDYVLEYYQGRRNSVASHHLVSGALGNLMERCWVALNEDQRKSRLLDLLGAPLIGMDGFTAQMAQWHPDPINMLRNDAVIPPFERNDQNETMWRGVVQMLVRALYEGGEPRSRALARVFALSIKNVLLVSEVSEIAEALWGLEHLKVDGLPTGDLGQDWLFLVLPEPQPQHAWQIFRCKWLSDPAQKTRLDVNEFGGKVTVAFNDTPNDPAYMEDTIWNVGVAIVRLKAYRRPLKLADSDAQSLIDLVDRWSDIPIPQHQDEIVNNEIRRNLNWATQGLEPILAEIEVSQLLGDKLFKKCDGLIESGIPAYSPFGRLAVMLPQHHEVIVGRIEQGMLSNDEKLAIQAIDGLASWLKLLSEGSTTDENVNLPTELIEKLGMIIATRRKQVLRETLELAAWIFEHGLDDFRNMLLVDISIGLLHLADELKYDVETEYDDVYAMRLQCVKLVSSMANAGFDQRPEVIRWLEIAADDPFPEIRPAVGPK